MIIKKSILKIAGLLLIVGLNWTGLLAVGNTVSTFNDTENSPGNTFLASTLYFSLGGDNFLPDITPTQNTLRTININNDGSLDFNYSIKSNNVSGDLDLCSNLNLSATLGAYNYSGPISGFDYSAGQFSTVGGNWQFEINLTSSNLSLQGKNCTFDFVFDGTQIGGVGFSDQETISNTVNSGEWEITPSLVAPGPGDVVINEIMWMGSSSSTADEWIELRNMTGSAIDISGWAIEKSATDGGTLTIPVGKTIPANGYFLIANYNKDNSSSDLNISPDWVTTSLYFANSVNGNVILKSQVSTTIDSAIGTSVWPAGINTTLQQSMERDDTPGDGTLAGSWHTCVDSGCKSGIYWDTADGNNYGTPGAANLSTNDPTASDYVLTEETAPTEEVAPIEEITAEESVDSPADADGVEPAVETPAIIVVPEVPADNPPAETAVQADNTTAE